MEVGIPSETVTVVVAALMVPWEALIVVVQTPATVLAGETSPLALTVAHVGSLELQITFPVRSWVEPSLKVPVADIWIVVFGFTVMVCA
jgi:hypothetical protein